jgi:hypothetical protein
MFESYTLTCSYFNPQNAMGEIPVNDNRPFQFASSTCEITASSTESTATTSTKAIPVYFENSEVSTSTDIFFAGHLTAGDLAIITLLLFIIIATIFIGAVQALGRITTSKTYLQYRGGDVEIRKDL